MQTRLALAVLFMLALSAPELAEAQGPSEARFESLALPELECMLPECKVVHSQRRMS